MLLIHSDNICEHTVNYSYCSKLSQVLRPGATAFFFFSIVASFFIFYLLTWIQRFQRVLHDPKSHTCCCQICNHLLNFKDVHQRATVRHWACVWLLQAEDIQCPFQRAWVFMVYLFLFQKQADKQPRNPASPALTKQNKTKQKNAPGPRCILVLHLPTLPPVCPLVTTATVWTQGTF